VSGRRGSGFRVGEHVAILESRRESSIRIPLRLPRTSDRAVIEIRHLLGRTSRRLVSLERLTRLGFGEISKVESREGGSGLGHSSGSGEDNTPSPSTGWKLHLNVDAAKAQGPNEHAAGQVRQEAAPQTFMA